MGRACCVQVLVDLDSALLDDQPHWYKLQLPDGSPYLHRRDLQPEETLSSRRLQSETHTHTHTRDWSVLCLATPMNEGVGPCD